MHGLKRSSTLNQDLNMHNGHDSEFQSAGAGRVEIGEYITASTVRVHGTEDTQTKSLWNRLVKLPKGSVVFFDLDEVVLANPPELSALNKATREAQEARLIESGKYTQEELNRLFWLWEYGTTAKGIDRNMPDLIEALKAEGIYCVGMTSRQTGYGNEDTKRRGFSREKATAVAVRDTGVKFSKDFFTEADVEAVSFVRHEVFMPNCQGPKIDREAAIAFSCGRFKGEFIDKVLENHQLPEGAVAVLVDDNRTYLDNTTEPMGFVQYCEQRWIKYLAVHFTGAAKHIQQTIKEGDVERFYDEIHSKVIEHDINFILRYKWLMLLNLLYNFIQLALRFRAWVIA